MRILLLLGLVSFSLLAQHEHNQNDSKGPVPLYTGLGSWRHPVATRSPEAQHYFNQGMALLYGFNRSESFHSFERAAKLDPNMAMAYWGMSAALGPYINMDLDPQYQIKESCAAAERGLELASVSATDKVWLEAAAARCPDFANPGAYISAMRALAAAQPDDPDAQALYAEALMIPNRWHWYKDGQPAEGEIEAEHILEATIRRFPQHPGANHLYIHAVESSANPERAIPSAQRLMGIMPWAGHMVHMPAHIWLVLGDYETAASVNERAAQVDREFFARRGVASSYYMYYLHNLTFIAYARGMQGRVSEGNAASLELQQAIGRVVKEMPDAVFMGGASVDVLLRNQQWEAVLKLPPPTPESHPLGAAWHAVRALAFCGKRDRTSAINEQKKFEGERAQVDAAMAFGNNKAGEIMALLSAVIQARLSDNTGDWKKAVAQQDALVYDEPPPFFYPIRESWGGSLLRKGDAAGAEQVFRDGLARTPHNGRMLFGLHASLKAQEKVEAAAWVEREFNAAWKGATLPLRLDDL